MTIEEAFDEIGLAPGASPGEIRRGYLRTLKTRKPEVDPEGFRRLREAYETLSERFQKDEPELVPSFPAPTFSTVFVPAADPPAPEPSPAAPPPPPESFTESPPVEAPPAAPAPLSPESVFIHLLELHARGALAEAAEVEARFRERLHASGQELRLFDTDLAILWSVVQELGQLDDVFPQAARTAIARAMLGGDLLAAYPEVARIAQEEAWQAAAIATRLHPLPVLCVFHEAFRIPPPPIVSGLPAPERVWPVWARVLQGVFLFCFVISFFRPSSQDLSKLPVGASPQPPVYYSTAQVGLLEVCGPPRPEGMDWVCFAAQKAVRAIEQGDCTKAWPEAFGLQREVLGFEGNPVPGVPPGAPRGLFEAIERRLRLSCGDP